MFVHADHLRCMHNCKSFQSGILYSDSRGVILSSSPIRNQVSCCLPQIVLNTFDCFQGGKIATHHVNSYLHSSSKNKKSISRQSAEDGFCKNICDLLLNRGSFCNYLSFVVQFTFTYMCTVANMCFAGVLYRSKCSCYSFIMCSTLGTSLLRMSAFGIWHN